MPISAMAMPTTAPPSQRRYVPNSATVGDHRHRKAHRADRGVVIRRSLQLVVRAVALDDVGDLAEDRADVVVSDARAQVDQTEAAGRNARAVTAGAGEEAFVVDEELEVDLIEPQPDRVGIVDAEVEVEGDGGRGKRQRDVDA